MSSLFGSGEETPRDLRVEIEIEPSESCGCPAAEIAREGGTLDEVRTRTSGGVCSSDIVYEDDDGSKALNVVNDVDESCFCPTIETFDMIPEIEAVDDGRITISALVSDRDDLKRTLSNLKETVDDVSLTKITEVEAENKRSIDLSDLTPKQADTLEKAVAWGYYEDPPKISLDGLAEEFEVSKSAVSQRLKRAESKIVANVV